MPEFIIRSPKDREQLSRLVWGLADKPWRVTISAYKSKRSLEQNDRFHKLIRLLAEETGEDPGRIKEWVKGEFGPMVVIQVGSASKTIPKPSSQYDTAEMSEVMDRFEAFCAREMGVMLG